MTRLSWHRSPTLLALGVAVAALSCIRGDRVSAPEAGGRGPLRAALAGGDQCGMTCPLFTNAGPLWSAVENPDSATIPVVIADLGFLPNAGDSVALQLTGDSTLISAIDSAEMVQITDGVAHQSYPLASLTMPTVVWRFAASDTTTLHITLNRALVGVTNGTIVLTSHSSSVVTGALRPWISLTDGSTGSQTSASRARSGRVLAEVLPTCAGGDVPIAGSGAFCGGSATFQPEPVSADAFTDSGATFQSPPHGHGVSHAITVTFSPAVSSVAVTAYDPTFDGNQMQAFDSNHVVIGTVAFPGNHTPGTDVPQHGTISGAISTVVLTPALLDYVAYSMTVRSSAAPATLQVTCDQTVVRGAMVQCTATVLPTQPYVVTARRSNAVRYSFASTDSIQELDGAPYQWEGQAVVSARVSMSVATIQGGNETPLASATDSFTVTPRTGPQWTGLQLQSVTPQPEYVAGPPLAANPFPTRGSLLAPDGATGQYQRVMTTPWGTVVTGPNTNLVYTRGPSRLEVPHIYVHAWLLPTSAFYRAQRGDPNLVLGTGPCTGADIDRLRNNVIAHEDLHYAGDKSFFLTHDVQALMEAAYAPFDASLIGQPTAEGALKAAHDAASDAAFGIVWDAVVKTAVDSQYPVQTSPCHAQQL